MLLIPWTIFSSANSYDTEMLRQIRLLCCRSNQIHYKKSGNNFRVAYNDNDNDNE